MQYVSAEFSKQNFFYGNSNPFSLIQKYGSPLYVYNEPILKKRCKEMKDLITYPHFKVNYSAKANSNVHILRILCNEGVMVDAMSPGEIFMELEAGFSSQNILYIGNNVSTDELHYAIDRGICVSVDSLSQLARYGEINPKSNVVIRYNPGIGAGHHAKVVTGGVNTKFGIFHDLLPEVKTICKKYELKIIGINQHIGSLFLKPDSYLTSIKNLLTMAIEFPDLEFLDFGGGFGVPYNIEKEKNRLDLANLGKKIDESLNTWTKRYNKNITIMIEPGRYMVAECGILLGTVHSVKMNYSKKYIGTDIGFNVLLRPILYNSYHELEVYRKTDNPSVEKEIVTVVGNICETGDIIAKERSLPVIYENDIIGVLNTGAYCSVMSSNYNNRLRPAEVLIESNGNDKLIRKRDSFEDLLTPFNVSI